MSITPLMYGIAAVVDASESKPIISMEPTVLDATNKLRAFLFQAVYTNPRAKGEETKVEAMLGKMYEYFIVHPEELGDELKKQVDDEGVERVVCDYIAGMTDRYALNKYKEIFLPKMWK